ncbi:MAG: hypothetical protein ABSB82_10550 [Terriglobia bacterium]|jgi:hypothetical protein
MAKQRLAPSANSSRATAATPAALGFRAHSGWAALVAIAGSIKSPAVVARRRIELADPKLPRPVQPYHMAREMALEEAAEYLKRFAEDSQRLAQQALREVIDHLREGGYRVIGCGIPTGSGRLPGSLESILASHPAVHTAEGELFRKVLARAGEKLRLPVLQVRERELLERAATELDMSVKDLERQLTELGQPVGPPWGKDQKLAALVAWTALAAQ